MSGSILRVFFKSLLFTALIATTAYSLQTKTGDAATSGKTVPASFEAAPNSSTARVVDLDSTVVFTVTMGVDNQPQFEFTGLDKKAVSLVGDLGTQAKKTLATAVDDGQQVKGVVIRFAKGVKSTMVNSIYDTIKSAMKANKIDQPIYIAVQEPKKRKADDIRTQEFVCKHQKAADLYDRVNKVARNFRVTVRLDPSRNSITAKGPSRSITLIQNMIAYLDKPDGVPAKSDNNNPAPKKSTGPNTVPKKNVESNIPEKKSVDNPSIEPGPRKNDLMPSPKIDGMPGSSVGRYQLSGVGTNLFLLDTATGDIWLLDPSREPLSWIKLPHVRGN